MGRVRPTRNEMGRAKEEERGERKERPEREGTGEGKKGERGERKGRERRGRNRREKKKPEKEEIEARERKLDYSNICRQDVMSVKKGLVFFLINSNPLIYYNVKRVRQEDDKKRMETMKEETRSTTKENDNRKRRTKPSERSEKRCNERVIDKGSK